MATQLGLALAPGEYSLPASVRPAKSNFYPYEIYVRSTITGDKFNVEISPTTDRDDWVTLTQLTANVATADGQFAKFLNVTDLSERVRVQFDPSATGVGEAMLVPGA